MDSARHVIKLIWNLRVLNRPAPYDVARTIHQSLQRGANAKHSIRRWGLALIAHHVT
jgi:hypothetical protein